MKLRQNLIWLLSALLLTCFSTVMAGRLSIRYTPGNTAQNRAIEKTLKTDRVFQNAINKLNRLYRFPNKLSITFTNKLQAHFSPTKKTILLGYPYLERATQKFLKAAPNSTTKQLNSYMQNVGVWIFMHELCHSLIYFYRLPTVGYEEVAADSFATVLPLLYFSNGLDIALDAADYKMLGAIKISKLKEYNFTDYHTLNRQRQYFILCMIYGYNAKEAKKIFDTWDAPALHKFIKTKSVICIEDYQQQRYSWRKLMRKYRR